MYKVRIESPNGREFETIERWDTREEAKAYVKRKRKEPGWHGLRWFVVQA